MNDIREGVMASVKTYASGHTRQGAEQRCYINIQPQYSIYFYEPCKLAAR